MAYRPYKHYKHKDIPITTHYTELPILTARAHYEDLIEEARTCITQDNYEELTLSVLPKLRKLCVHFIVYNEPMDEVFYTATRTDQFEYQDVSTNLHLQSILTRRVLQEKDKCSICLSIPSHAVITRCSHVFCYKCIIKWFTRGKSFFDPNYKDPTSCPDCRGLLKLNDMFSETKPTTKVEILIQLLREESTSTKSVIFTRYDITVLYFLTCLRIAGFKAFSYTTKEMPRNRNKIKEFENIDEPVVLLIDFETSRKRRVTINAACRVFLLDACRKSIEEELVARVRQPLSVLRLISQNTIEDKILSLKETFSQTDTFDFVDKETLRYIFQQD